ncbi:MAG: hypothetical protein U0791_08410 [Gemmataceae bacterium]
MFRRILIPTALAILAAVAVGCFNSHNPGYFPYELPGGRIEQSHAKPRFGFFRDFDPKAHRLEVTPKDATAPLGSQIVLVATVYDKDGDPRRSRRVEWMLEGPGNIIEVDEAGLYAGRGYKVDNKYGVTYTSYTSHTITRGNDDPKDDVELCPGQTFCVVSSAVPGETSITAYAPGVFNWEKGRVVSKIVWGEGRFSFPAPTAVRFGGEATLSTSLTAIEQNSANPPNFKVRYKLLDGDSVAAEFRSTGGSGTSLSQAGLNTKEAETILDASGAATVKLVQPNPLAGKSRVAVEVIKPSENGVGPGVVVSRRETVVEWAAPDVKLDVAAPHAAVPNTTVPVTVILANVGKVDARESRVRVTLSDGATLEKSEPPPLKQEAGALVFYLPALAAGKKHELALQVRPAKLGSFTTSAEVATVDGLQGRKDAVTRVEAGRLGLLIESPPVGLSGEKVPVKIAVTNSGATAGNNVTVWARFDNGLTHTSGQNPVELPVGSLAAGQTKVVELPLSAKGAGKYAVRATATADGNLTATAEAVSFEVRRAELKAAATGPKLAYLGADFTWSVDVTNAGEGPVSNVRVRATLPAEVKLRDAGDGKPGPGSVEWVIPAMKAGEQKTVKLNVEAARISDRAALAVAVTADATGGGTGAPVGDPVQARAESSVAIIGAAAVSLELLAPTGALEAGKRTTFQVRVKNKGTIPAHNIDVAAFAPAELKALRAYGKAEGRIDAEGKVTFPVIEELRAGDAITFTVEAEAVQTGDGRLRAEVKAAELSAALKEEQPVRVIGR